MLINFLAVFLIFELFIYVQISRFILIALIMYYYKLLVFVIFLFIKFSLLLFTISYTNIMMVSDVFIWTRWIKIKGIWVLFTRNTVICITVVFFWLKCKSGIIIMIFTNLEEEDRNFSWSFLKVSIGLSSQMISKSFESFQNLRFYHLCFYWHI